MKQKTPWCVVALADDGRSATITIRGAVGDWMEGKSANELDWQLEGIGAVNEIIVRISSFGGKLEHGLAMYNALRRHPARVVSIIDGVAASAGSLIAMAGDEIRIYANAAMMVHGVTMLDENDDPVESDEASRVLNATMAETYAERTGKSVDEIMALMTAETWMTAREAVAAGFADSIVEIARTPAAAVASGSLMAIASACGIPVDVIERAAAESQMPAEEPPAGSPTDSHAGGPNAAGVAPASQAATVANDAESPTFAAQVNACAMKYGMGDYVAAWLLDASIGTAAEAEAAIREAREVRELCAIADASDLAAGFIRTRTSLAAVRTELINARAAASDAAHTDGHPQSSTRIQPPRAGSMPAVSIASIYSTLNNSARH